MRSEPDDDHARTFLTVGILIALFSSPGRSQETWREIRYRESTQSFPNSERGFYAPRMSHRIGRLDGLHQRGITLVLIEADSKAFKERDISQEKLDEVRRAFAAVRQNGLKTIVRFAYGFTGRDYRADPGDRKGDVAKSTRALRKIGDVHSRSLRYLPGLAACRARHARLSADTVITS